MDHQKSQTIKSQVTTQRHNKFVQFKYTNPSLIHLTLAQTQVVPIFASSIGTINHKLESLMTSTAQNHPPLYALTLQDSSGSFKKKHNYKRIQGKKKQGKEKIRVAKSPTKGNVYEASALNYDLNTAISALSRIMFFFLSTRDVFPPLFKHLSQLYAATPVGFSLEKYYLINGRRPPQSRPGSSIARK